MEEIWKSYKYDAIMIDDELFCSVCSISELIISPISQGFNSDTVWVDSLWKLSQILYESVTDSLTDGHGFFTVLVCPLEEEWKW